MSKRAIEEAWKAYPKGPEQKFITAYGTFEFDHDAPNREGFIKGYEAAEKDLALTVEDLELLHTFLYAVKNNKQGAFTFTRLSDEQYQEVLKRFKEAKK